MLAALLATSAFAEISIGGWGRGLWAPFGYDGDAKMTNGISWGGSVPRVGITVAGDSENVGFAFGLHADGGNVGIHDIAYVWAKPWDFLKISVGKIQDDTLRVCNGFGQFNWLRTGAGWRGEDLTFRRIGGYGGYTQGGECNGAEIALTPIDGLYIAAGFKMDQTVDFVDVLKLGQYAVGYKIEDLLAVKAQYIGGNPGEGSGWAGEEFVGLTDYCGIINVAVDLLMIENNYISIGVYLPTDFDKEIDISAVYHGGFDALSLNALVGAMIQKHWTGLEIGVGVGYDLGNGLGIEADVRTELSFPESGDTTGDITVGAFFTKGFANGVCGIGAEVAIPFGDGRKVGISTFADSDKVHFAIPVKVEYWF